ncbi:TetR/AcrR family transcriptional regulator [Actinoplanes sp. NPDC049681]|uniref:TetR/AcrR family transcriptional regulator n=1 Tax=Actinoplanes sp. NPDC049681 TaxID=3363905 RepID=UPI0037B7935A
MARTAAAGTRERILAAVVPLFYRHGVRAVGMAQVIEAAGCGKNLVYRHFPGKADLAAAYLEEVRGRRERSARQAVHEAGDPRNAVLALVGEIAGLVRDPEFRGCAMRNYLTEFPGEDDAPARVARDYLTTTRAHLDDLVRRAGGGPGTADRIWLVIEGLYASAGRPDAARAAEVALTLTADLLPRP